MTVCKHLVPSSQAHVMRDGPLKCSLWKFLGSTHHQHPRHTLKCALNAPQHAFSVPLMHPHKVRPFNRLYSKHLQYIFPSLAPLARRLFALCHGMPPLPFCFLVASLPIPPPICNMTRHRHLQVPAPAASSSSPTAFVIPSPTPAVTCRLRHPH